MRLLTSWEWPIPTGSLLRRSEKKCGGLLEGDALPGIRAFRVSPKVRRTLLIAVGGFQEDLAPIKVGVRAVDATVFLTKPEI